MAVTSVCGKLISGMDLTCLDLVRKYYQQIVLINKADIATYEVEKPSATECKYSVKFTLKTGATGYRIASNEGGNGIFGSVDKKKGALGAPEYVHKIQIIMAGITEQSKCMLDALDRNSYVAALQATDGTVEVFGMVNGLGTGDYTYNIQENGGATFIPLNSDENAPEGMLPLIYKSNTAGSESADFDAAFAN